MWCWSSILYFSNRFLPGDEQSEPVTLKIGSNNVFEVYSTIDGVKSIGDNNIFESKSMEKTILNLFFLIEKICFKNVKVMLVEICQWAMIVLLEQVVT